MINDLLWFFDGDVRAEFPIFNDDRDPIESPTARADDPPSDTNPNIQSRIGDNLHMIYADGQRNDALLLFREIIETIVTKFHELLLFRIFESQWQK